MSTQEQIHEIVKSQYKHYNGISEVRKVHLMIRSMFGEEALLGFLIKNRADSPPEKYKLTNEIKRELKK